MVTIKDVAKLAGVSPSTASRALHDNNMISQATKDKVRKAMEELDYSPNYSAQNLVKKQSNTVGIILPFRGNSEELGDNPFFMQIIQGISEICSKEGYLVSLATGHYEEELLATVQNMVRSGRIAKFIFLYSKTHDKVFDYIMSVKSECVVVGQSYNDDNKHVRYVNNDNLQAGKDATSYLLKKGYQHISYLYTDMDELVQAERYMGYAEEMKKKGLKAQTAHLKELLSENSSGNQSLKEYLDLHSTEAFVTCDDISAIQLQGLLNEEDASMAIISFNNSILAKIANPSLTSVEIFPYQLGEEAANLLLKGETNYQKPIIVSHAIIERQSS